MPPSLHHIRRGLAAGTLIAASVAAAAAGPVLSAEAQEAADRARTKVVILKTARAGGRGVGTGFIAGPRLVITAGHVVRDATGITAFLNGVSYPAAVAAAHPEHDIAILTLKSPELLLKAMEIARGTADLGAGEELVVLAGPSQPAAARGEPNDRVAIPALFRRHVRLPGGSGPGAPMLMLAASVLRGDSGSPVIRVRDRRVVGVLSSRELPDASGVSQLAYAVPAEVVQPWLAAAARAGRSEEEFYLFRR